MITINQTYLLILLSLAITIGCVMGMVITSRSEFRISCPACPTPKVELCRLPDPIYQ